jgi:hypothetical protein
MESSPKLPNVRHPLPLELNCEIFKCLEVPIQTKFIWAMGRDIYSMFRHKLLVKVILYTICWNIRSFSSFFKTKRLRNPRENLWIRTTTTNGITPQGKTIYSAFVYFLAKLAFKISGDCRKKDDYPGTILYYFEVARISSSNSKW